jgi:hypothetical protein
MGNEYFMQCLGLNYGGPGGVLQICGVVGGQDSVEVDIFGRFQPYAEALEDG